jgi:hypothetical protein
MSSLPIRLPLLKALRFLQTLTGVIAMVLIPFLWGAWSTNVLLTTLGIMIGSAILFVVLAYVLEGPFRRGEI